MLQDKTAVVTGAGRNIGRGISEALAAEGASIAVVDIDEERANDVVDSLPDGEGQTHSTFPVDATDPDAVQRVGAEVDDKYGGIDVLVNNLGYAANTGIFDVTLEEWTQVMDLTLWSAFIWSKYVGTRIAESGGGGAIINLGSTLGHRGTSDKTAYCAAKGGVINMTEALAQDFAPHDVRVNSISPGLVNNPVGLDSGREDRDPNRIPLGRIGEPEDIGDAAVFLASDQSDYITGTDILVSGGL